MKEKDGYFRLQGFVVLFLAFLVLAGLFVPTRTQAEDIYRFKTMWPTLPQPWYFNWPEGVAVDRQGNVYVADFGNARIQKFTSDGEFIAKWGREGSRNGQFNLPYGIAVDSGGNVHVADIYNHRIQNIPMGESSWESGETLEPDPGSSAIQRR